MKDIAVKYGNFPVITAGGICNKSDIDKFFYLGADGVQLGTRFLASKESSASKQYKEAVINAKEDDIIVAYKPGSPCGLPFRILKNSPMYISTLSRVRTPKCNMGYVLSKDSDGRLTKCLAKDSDNDAFCICNGLLSSGGYNSNDEEPLYTVGVVAKKIDKILSVSEIFKELTIKS